MYNITSYNPAAAGSTDMGNASITIREQQMGFSDYADTSIGPGTQWFNVNIPMPKINSGIGAVIVVDEIGFEQTMDFKLTYAYQLELGNGTLGLGVNLGAVSYSFDLGGARYPNAIGGGTGSDSWLSQMFADAEDLFVFTMDAGVFYRAKDVYLGISSTKINKPSFDLAGSDVSYIDRNYWITAGYVYQTSNPLWVFKPSALVKSTLNFEEGISAIAQLSLDLLFQYNKFVIAGVSYNSGNDISPVLGVEISNGSKFDGLHVYAAYDYNWSALGAESYGSLEILIGYSFNLSIEKETKSYKSVRFL